MGNVDDLLDKPGWIFKVATYSGEIKQLIILYPYQMEDDSIEFLLSGDICYALKVSNLIKQHILEVLPDNGYIL